MFLFFRFLSSCQLDSKSAHLSFTSYYKASNYTAPLSSICQCELPSGAKKCLKGMLFNTAAATTQKYVFSLDFLVTIAWRDVAAWCRDSALLIPQGEIASVKRLLHTRTSHSVINKQHVQGNVRINQRR